MKKIYRAHPLMLLSFIKPFLFILIIPFIKAALQYILSGSITDVLGLEMTILSGICIWAIVRCISFRLICEENSVTVECGVFFRKKAKIKISSLSSVKTEQNPLDMLFRAVTFNINTEAGSKRRSDFKFKLSLKDAKEVSRLLYGEKKPSRVNFSAFKVAIMAATTSSAFAGILIGVPVINRIGKLLGIGINEMLLDEINNVSSKLETYFPPIINTVSLIFLLAYSISFIYSFFKFLNFRLLIGDDELEVRSGFFIRTRTSFKKRSVNNALIVQSPLMFLVRRYALKVSVGGFGESKSESQIIIPSAGYKEIKTKFSGYFPFLTPSGKKIKPKRNFKTKSRFLLWPSFFLSIVLASSIVFSLFFSEFDRLILFITTALLVLVFYYASICLFEYYKGEIILSKNIYIKSTKHFRTCELYCPKSKVGQIKITRFWSDKLEKTCRVKLFICSEGADSIRIRHLEYKTVKKEIENCFDLNV